MILIIIITIVVYDKLCYTVIRWKWLEISRPVPLSKLCKGTLFSGS